eukprot:TRINITY_DN77150_c0_g1_i1.p1 TRINITY_DN77150_c0_g1~~TRINITY_DN77150_c0_g1_i1.p1  ORF type:complete len:327 (-),score=41.70 TRINITY_DN77150_c0_g1_i1:182-1162(-)
MESPLGRKYRLRSKIGSGSFGNVFIGIHAKTGSEFAIKVEPIARKKRSHVLHEAKIYQALDGGCGIPRLHWYGTEGQFKILVLDLLGPSLEDLFCFCNRKFGLKTVLMLAGQMLRIIEYVHNKNVVHRDIKPANFVIGTGNEAHRVHLIDFGLAKSSRCLFAQQQQPTSPTSPTGPQKRASGNACFRSVNAHLGSEQGRRDDLESIGYVLVYLVRGSLPWQGLESTDKESEALNIRDSKLSTDLQDLCAGHDAEFATYIDYCRNLDFDAWPDYNYLHCLFTQVSCRRAYRYDFVYDWTICKPFCASTSSSPVDGSDASAASSHSAR